MNTTIGKLLYGALFVVLLPALLLLWNTALQTTLPSLPALGTPLLGWILVVGGGGMVLAGWFALARYGRGLPMNAFPPQHFVQRGMYALTPHPIYTGFVLAIIGYCMAVQSGAGLWIIAPSVLLGCIALVLGYERHDLQHRFGNTVRNAWLRLPTAEHTPPSTADYLSVFVLLFLPWLAMYELAIAVGAPPDAMSTYLPFEHHLPVVEWTELLYAFCYPFVLVAPFCSRTKSNLRTFMLMGWWATAIGALCFVLFPFTAPPRPFHATTLWGNLLLLERAADGATAAFPSFHVIWAFLAAWLYTRAFAHPVVWYGIATAIAASCIGTGMHSLADIGAAALVLAIVFNGSRLWQGLLRATERLANSWREWRLGRVRIIVHGAYAGAAAWIGIALLALIAPQHLGEVVLLAFCTVLGAGVWGQVVEGSSKLARPFGYYGGLFGAIAGLLLLILTGADGWLFAGALSIAAPFIQAVGRLRCLVQGCCHGRPCSAHCGIVYTRTQSRVLYLANLGHQPVYPTQLYSILYNLVLGVLLLRAWTLAIPFPIIAGSYLMVSSLGRFVEESYRGEPQTPRYTGLPLYQWLALAGIVGGAFLTAQPSAPYTPMVVFSPVALLYATLGGILTACAMGVDVPQSQRRFSRLS